MKRYRDNYEEAIIEVLADFGNTVQCSVQYDDGDFKVQVFDKSFLEEDEQIEEIIG